MKGYYELKFEEFFSHLDGGLRVSCNDARPAEDKESGTKVGRTLRGHEALGTGAYKLSDMDGREFAPHMEYCNLKKMLSLVEVSWYQNLKECFGNNPSPPVRDTLDFDLVFVIGKMKASIQGKDNAIKKLRTQISQLKETRSEADRTLDFRTLESQITQLNKKVIVLQEENELFRAENEKVKQHYKELYDYIKIMRAKHIEQTTALLTKNENLKAQILENLKCNTMESVKPRVLTSGRYAIDVDPIPPHNRNNMEVHLHYLKHLKESVETLHEIVEEAKVDRPLDRSIVSACRYTKHSKELLEYAIGTCQKAFNQQDKKYAPTPLIRKNYVTFEEQCDTSNSNTHKHIEQLNTQKTNVPVPHSTRVNCCTNASGLQPRSNTKKIGSHQLKASPSIHNIHNVVSKVKKVWKLKQVRQVWKPTSKVLTSVGHQWRPTGRIFTLGEQCPLTRLTKLKVAPAKQNENQAITYANQ
ncbi:hypothetical protein Tco_1555715 [Tanacetum coccineum]